MYFYNGKIDVKWQDGFNSIPVCWWYRQLEDNNHHARRKVSAMMLAGIRQPS